MWHDLIKIQWQCLLKPTKQDNEAIDLSLFTRNPYSKTENFQKERIKHSLPSSLLNPRSQLVTKTAIMNNFGAETWQENASEKE